MKKFLTLCLVLILTITCAATLSACGHKFSDDWTSDETQHWHACTQKNCTEKADAAPHTFDSGEITSKPTATSAGTKTYTCTVCGWQKQEGYTPTAEEIFLYFKDVMADPVKGITGVNFSLESNLEDEDSGDTAVETHTVAASRKWNLDLGLMQYKAREDQAWDSSYGSSGWRSRTENERIAEVVDDWWWYLYDSEYDWYGTGSYAEKKFVDSEYAKHQGYEYADFSSIFGAGYAAMYFKEDYAHYFLDNANLAEFDLHMDRFDDFGYDPVKPTYKFSYAAGFYTLEIKFTYENPDFPERWEVKYTFRAGGGRLLSCEGQWYNYWTNTYGGVITGAGTSITTQKTEYLYTTFNAEDFDAFTGILGDYTTYANNVNIYFVYCPDPADPYDYYYLFLRSGEFGSAIPAVDYNTWNGTSSGTPIPGFQGWYLDPDCTVQYDMTTFPSYSLTVYARITPPA